MRISGLAESTGVPVATLKYYLREGLLHPGRATSRTQATYDDTHVERVRLVRALTEVGGLPLATVGRVLAVIDDPDAGRLGVLEAAQHSLSGPAPVDGSAPDDDPAGAGRAGRWLARRGWLVAPGTPAIADLERAWDACDAADIGVDEARMDAYADAVERIAAVDIDSVPSDAAAAVRQVVLGTVLVDPLLAALRRLAHQHVSVSREAG